MHRAFDTWSQNHPLISFTEVTDLCAADGTLNENCAHAEIWVTYRNVTAPGDPVAVEPGDIQAAVAIPKFAITNDFTFTNGQQPRVRLSPTLTVQRQTIEVQGGRIEFEFDHGMCWWAPPRTTPAPTAPCVAFAPSLASAPFACDSLRHTQLTHGLASPSLSSLTLCPLHLSRVSAPPSPIPPPAHLHPPAHLPTTCLLAPTSSCPPPHAPCHAIRYLDSNFCAAFHRLKHLSTPSAVHALGATILFTLWSFAAVSIAVQLLWSIRKQLKLRAKVLVDRDGDGEIEAHEVLLQAAENVSLRLQVLHYRLLLASPSHLTTPDPHSPDTLTSHPHLYLTTWPPHLA